MHLSAAVVNDLRFYFIDPADQLRGQDFFRRSVTFQNSVLQYIDLITVCCCNIQIVNSGDHGYIKFFTSSISMIWWVMSR